MAFYNQRAAAENLIKEANNDAGLAAPPDIDLAAKTIGFKEKLAQGAPLDDLLIEAFAVVREAGLRFLNMRHFDVQLYR